MVVRKVMMPLQVVVKPDRVEPFVFPFEVVKIIDGDTIRINIDLGFWIGVREQTLRLLRVNTPEIKGPTREAGMRAKAFTRAWFDSHTNIMIRSRKREPGHAEKDAFGRYLVEVFGDDEGGQQSCLNDALLQSGNAVPFMESE